MPPQSARRPSNFIVILLVLGVLGGALVAAYFLYQPFRHKAEELPIAQRMPADLQGAYLVEKGTGGTASFYEIGEFGFTYTPKPRLVPPGALSPDGTRGVIARQRENIIPSITITPSAWAIEVFIVPDGEPTEVAQGYGPAFLDDTHIGYFSDTGYTVLDLTSGETLFTSPFSTGSTLGHGVQYSPDRTLVMWTDAATKETIVARVDTGTYERIGTFTEPALRLMNEAVYELRPTPEGMELRSYPLTGGAGTSVTHLPAHMKVQLIQP
jgi:hypothetical protein